jgi:hypothetical protein
MCQSAASATSVKACTGSPALLHADVPGGAMIVETEAGGPRRESRSPTSPASCAGARYPIEAHRARRADPRRIRLHRHVAGDRTRRRSRGWRTWKELVRFMHEFESLEGTSRREPRHGRRPGRRRQRVADGAACGEGPGVRHCPARLGGGLFPHQRLDKRQAGSRRRASPT